MTHFLEICYNVLIDISIYTHKQDRLHFQLGFDSQPVQYMKNWPSIAVDAFKLILHNMALQAWSELDSKK